LEERERRKDNLCLYSQVVDILAVKTVATRTSLYYQQYITLSHIGLHILYE